MATNSFEKGLHTDNAPHNQPEGTYKYALNAVNETEEGNQGSVSNETGQNDLDLSLIKTDKLQPIGQVYLNNNTHLIFAVISRFRSAIYLYKDKTLTKLVDDTKVSKANRLNFNPSHQIDAVYRLRRGCERVIYFTDSNNTTHSC